MVRFHGNSMINLLEIWASRWWSGRVMGNRGKHLGSITVIKTSWIKVCLKPKTNKNTSVNFNRNVLLQGRTAENLGDYFGDYCLFFRPESLLDSGNGIQFNVTFSPYKSTPPGISLNRWEALISCPHRLRLTVSSVLLHRLLMHPRNMCFRLTRLTWAVMASHIWILWIFYCIVNFWLWRNPPRRSFFCVRIRCIIRGSICIEIIPWQTGCTDSAQGYLHQAFRSFQDCYSTWLYWHLWLFAV